MRKTQLPPPTDGFKKCSLKSIYIYTSFRSVRMSTTEGKSPVWETLYRVFKWLPV